MAITYAVVAWLIIQVAAATFQGFGIPDWAFRFVVIMLILGLPIALIITWAFELTPEGVKLTRQVTADERAGSSQSKRNRLAFAFAAGLPTLIFGTLAAFFYFTRGVPEAVGSPLDKSIAVLPFRNVSADADNAYFCDGVQEDILTTLANIGDLQVISRTSVMRYKDTEKSIPEIGLELGVSYILEGSVQRSGSRVRVTGQLINARTDEHLWAKNYDRDLTDIFAIQGEISREIAQSLRAVLTPDEVALIEKSVHVHPAAYDLVLKGRAIERANDIGNREKSRRCEVLFEAATEMDPEYVDAWVELSYTHVRNYFQYFDATEERLDKARQAIDRAIDLDPESSKVMIGLGNYYYYGHKDYDRAREQYLKALVSSPNNADALASLGYISRREGKWEETLHYFQESNRLDPNNVILLNNYQDFLMNIRHHDDAIRLARQYAELAPDDPFNELRILIAKARLKGGNLEEIESYFAKISPQQMQDEPWHFHSMLMYLMWIGDVEGYVRLCEGPKPDDIGENDYLLKIVYGRALKILGRQEEAMSIFADLVQSSEDKLKDDPHNEAILGTYAVRCALLGNRDKAIQILDKLLDSAKESDQLRYSELLGHKLTSLIDLGDMEAALDLLEEWIRMPYSPDVFSLQHHINFYPIQDHPRFKQLVSDPKNIKPII